MENQAIVNTAELLVAANLAKKACGKDALCLTSFHLKARNSALSLTATNNRIGLEVTVPANVWGEWDSAPSADHITKLLACAANGELEQLSITPFEDNTLVMDNEEGRYVTKGTDPRAMPLLPEWPPSDTEWQFMQSADLARTIKQVMSSNPKGVQGYDKTLFERKDDKLFFVGTDTVRLAIVEHDGYPGEDFGLCIPSSSLVILSRVLPKTGVAAFAVKEDMVYVAFNNVRAYLRSPNNEFPAWRKIIPKAHDKELTFERKPLINMLKALMPIAKDSKYKLRIVWPKEVDGEVSFDTATHEGNASRKRCALDHVGTKFELALNCKFLLDGLTAFDSEAIVVSATSSVHPVTISDPAANGHGFRYLIMPINI